MKKPFKIILTIFVIVAIAALVLYYLNLKNPADSQTEGNTLSFNNLSYQLPRAIKTEDAVDAVLSYRQSGDKNLSEQSKSILDTINNGLKEKAKIEAEEISNNTEPSDLIVYLQDADGNYLSPLILQEQLSETKNVSLFGSAQALGPDQVFDIYLQEIDSKIADEVKKVLYEYYNQLVISFGPIHNYKDKIKVSASYDLPLSVTGIYFPDLNEIQINDKYLVFSPPMPGWDSPLRPGLSTAIVHELAHAFHGLYNLFLPDIWKDGFASAISESLINPSYSNHCLMGYIKSETENVSFRDFEDRLDRYYWGGMIFSKIFVENRNFFTLINNKIYAKIDSNVGVPISYLDAKAKTQKFRLYNVDLVGMIPSIVPTIENLPAEIWLANRFALVDSRQNTASLIQNGSIFVSTDYFNLTSNGRNALEISVNPVPSPSYSINIFNASNQKIGNKDFTSQSQTNILVNYADIITDPNWSTYEGILRIEIKMNNQIREQFIPRIRNYQGQIYGLSWGAIDSQVDATGIVGGDWVNISGEILDKNGNIINKINQKLPIKNGLFMLSNKLVENAGKFKAELHKTNSGVYNQDKPVEKIVTRYFNKIYLDSGSVIILINPTDTQCCFETSTLLNGDVQIQAKSCLKPCGQVAVNSTKVPFRRCWGQNCTFTKSSAKFQAVKIYLIDQIGQEIKKYLSVL